MKSLLVVCCFIFFCLVRGPLLRRDERVQNSSVSHFYDHCHRYLQSLRRFVDDVDIDAHLSQEELQVAEDFYTRLLDIMRRFTNVTDHNPDIATDLEHALNEARTLLHHMIQLNSAPEDQRAELHPVVGQQQQQPLQQQDQPLQQQQEPQQLTDIELAQAEHLQRLLDTRHTIAEIARSGEFGTYNRGTLYSLCKRYGVKTRSQSLTPMTPAGLRRIVTTLHQSNVNAGQEQMWKMLEARGIRVTRDSARAALRTVDPQGTISRWALVVQRRRYTAKRANSCWHIDCNHALRRFGISVHGAIDGYSRIVPYLYAGAFTDQESALRFFFDGIRDFGMPSRVRVDHGTEFKLLERFIASGIGGFRCILIASKSVHNQRIERMWRDVVANVLIHYYNIFAHLEDNHLLHEEDYVELWVLQFVFLPRINADLMSWSITRAKQGVRTEHFKSPNKLWYGSMTKTCREESQCAVAHNVLHWNIDMYADNIRDEFGIDPKEEHYLESRYPCPLSNEELAMLNATVDVLALSDSYGIDIYVEVIGIVQDFELNREIPAIIPDNDENAPQREEEN